MVTLKINERTVKVPEGTTVLDAALSNGIKIPTLCKHARLSPFGGCRMCLVEVEGTSKLFTGCTTPVWEDMEVKTHTPRLEEIRKTVVELMLSDHPNDCMVCEQAGDCTLQDMAYEYGIKEIRFKGERRKYDKRDGNQFIERDMEKCVMCGRCVKACDEIQGVGAIDFAYRGFKSKITPPFEHDLDCEFCGQCISVCPTGALSGKQWAGLGRQHGVRKINTVCAYCGTGCNLTLHVKENRVIRVTSNAGTPNKGLLCVKGRFGYSFINSPDRLKAPLIRKKGKLVESSWDEALEFTAKRLSEIKEKNGPDSIAGLSSARCTNEDNYLFQKFIRAAVGTNNVDHCARL
jgi:predicted molibdopterin-dependent oxidoreductase YjgC